MIPIHSNIVQVMRSHFEKLENWHGKNELIPVCFENNIFNFHMYREVRSTETNNVNDADPCRTKNSQQSGNGMAEQCAREPEENSESTCGTNW